MPFQINLRKIVLTKWQAAIVVLVLLVEGALYLSLYTQAVIPVMGEVCGDPQSGALYWCNLPVGSFFPFPPVREGVYLVFPMTWPMGTIDKFIYRSLLITGLIFDITLIWWLGTMCYGLLLGILLIRKVLKTLPRARFANEDKETT